MLREVQASSLDIFGDAEAHGGVDSAHRDARHDGRPGGNGEDTNDLDAKLLATGASVVDVGVGGVLDVGVCAEDADGDDTPSAASAVDGEGVEGVVDPELEEQVVGANVDDARDDTDDEGHPGVDDGAAGGNADETGEDAVEGQADVIVALEELGEDHRGDGAGSSREGGGHRDLAGEVGGVARDHEGGAAVEAVPAEPEDEGAEGAHGRGGAGHFVGLLGDGVEAADTGSEDDGADEASDAASHVDDAGAGEVNHAIGGRGAGEKGAVVLLASSGVFVGHGAPRREEAVAPAPVDDDGVDEGGEDEGDEDVALEFAALGNGSRDNGGHGSRECPLEEPAGPAVGGIIFLSDTIEDFDATKVGGADESARGGAVGKTIAEEPEGNGCDACVDEILEEDVDDVLLAHSAGLEHGEASLHEEDEGTCEAATSVSIHAGKA